ncbi:hypothetical protein [Flavobacterium sp.]|uniref:hypothetical protein n=1 Tax=Flavobacterium sp. TaxID=239 RepID=UPI002603DE6F|nr:hypothetical protein [Flavobacterium sp.]MDD2987128.1 hypothetical protein [Flavobacterium sp.]
MNENKQSLMKLFSLVLKNRAKSEPEFREISPEMVKFFSRKELIEIITMIFDGNVPEKHNLVEMENDGLLKLIGDDLYIISYVTQKWCEQIADLPLKPDVPLIPATVAAASAKANANSSTPKKEDLKTAEEKKD